MEIARSWYKGSPDRRFPNGENKNELVERFKKAVSQVLDESDGKPAVLLGHGGIFITGLSDILTNVDRRFFYENRWLNCGVSTVDVSNDNGQLSAKLIKFCDVSFLKGDAANQNYPLPKFKE